MRNEDKKIIAVLIFFIFLVVSVVLVSCQSSKKDDNKSNIESNSNIKSNSNIDSSNNIDDNNKDSKIPIDSNSNSNIEQNSNSNQLLDINKLSFVKSSYDVKLNNTLALSINVEPSGDNINDLIWTSSNTSIATVSNDGIVTGKKEGTTTITVGTKDGKIKTTTKVNVKSNVASTNTFTATFVANGATSISKTKISCTTTQSSCTITTPNIVRNNYDVMGWNTNKNATSAQVGANKSLKLTKNVTYYAITGRKVNVTFLDKVQNTKTIKTCSYYNEQRSCSVTIPYYDKVGSYGNTWHYKETPNKYSALYVAGHKLDLSSNATYYAQYKHPSYYTAYSRKSYHEVRNFNIAKVYKIGHTTFEYESGIPTSVITKHYNFMKETYKDIPWLYIPAKVFVLTSETYNKYSIAYGLTSYSGSYGYIDVQYDVGYGGISENATLHEMAHAWDGYYGYMTGTGISSQTDVKNFYNGLSSDKKEGLNIVEFVAGFTTEYYWHYMGADPTEPSYVGYKDKYTATEKNKVVQIFKKYINNSKKWI